MLGGCKISRLKGRETVEVEKIDGGSVTGAECRFTANSLEQLGLTELCDVDSVAKVKMVKCWIHRSNFIATHNCSHSGAMVRARRDLET